MARLFFLIFSFWLFNLVISPATQPGEFPSSNPNQFEDAVKCIKRFEGWHNKKHYPYVGYGHKLLPNDKFDHTISESFADSLLRKDLRQKCAVFRDMGRDSLLLGVLAYNIGEYKVLKSSLYRKLKSGNRDIYREYTSFRKYKGKVIPSLERRRKYEYELLYVKE